MKPKRLKIGLHTYPVKWVAQPFENACGQTLAGEICHGYGEKRRITVTEDATSDPQETLMHELLHGIVVDRDIDTCFCEGMEEHVVTTLSRGLMAALRENKGLAAYLGDV